MCPLRVVLIFLSATLAGFFVLRNLTAQPELMAHQEEGTMEESISFLTKVRTWISYGFWTGVDMASGRYLWTNLVSSNKHRC